MVRPPPEIVPPPEVVVSPTIEELPTIVPMAPPVAKKKTPWPVIISIPLAAIAGITMLTRAAEKA